MPSESFAKLHDPDRLGFLPPFVVNTVRADLYSRMYRDPHSDAVIAGVRMCGEPDGIPTIEIDVTVTVYPSNEAITQFYRSGFEGLMRAPTEIDICHTVVVEMD